MWESEGDRPAQGYPAGINVKARISAFWFIIQCPAFSLAYMPPLYSSRSDFQGTSRITDDRKGSAYYVEEVPWVVTEFNLKIQPLFTAWKQLTGVTLACALCIVLSQTQKRCYSFIRKGSRTVFQNLWEVGKKILSPLSLQIECNYFGKQAYTCY